MDSGSTSGTFKDSSSCSMHLLIAGTDSLSSVAALVKLLVDATLTNAWMPEIFCMGGEGLLPILSDCTALRQLQVNTALPACCFLTRLRSRRIAASDNTGNYYHEPSKNFQPRARDGALD